LRQDDDLLREEIERALGRPDLTVIPVLVEQAVMPAAEDLPESLRPLAKRQAMVLTDARWEHDVALLVERVGELVGDRRRRNGGRRGSDRRADSAPRRRKPVALAALVAVVALATGMFTLRDAVFPSESDDARASLAGYQRSVAKVCAGLSDAQGDVGAISKRMVSRLRSAKTFAAQRAALLDAARSTTARSAEELAAFEALSSPPSSAARGRATLASWTANQTRLGTFEQRIEGARNVADLRASIRYLTSIKPKLASDGIDVRAGLLNLGGGTCVLAPQAALATPTLPQLATTTRAKPRSGAARVPQQSSRPPAPARRAPARK
jgi:hypothetical protein